MSLQYGMYDSISLQKLNFHAYTEDEVLLLLVMFFRPLCFSEVYWFNHGSTLNYLNILRFTSQ